MTAPHWHVTGWDDTMGATVLELGERLYLERCARRVEAARPAPGVRRADARGVRDPVGGRAGRETGVGQAGREGRPLAV